MLDEPKCITGCTIQTAGLSQKCLVRSTENLSKAKIKPIATAKLFAGLFYNILFFAFLLTFGERDLSTNPVSYNKCVHSSLVIKVGNKL